MTLSAKSSLKRMSWTRGQSSGWAAFDLKQRQKQNIESEVEKDPFPPISGNPDSIPSCDKLLKKNHVPVKSFSSVLLPTANFPSLKGSGNGQVTLLGSDSGGKFIGTTPQQDVNLAVKKLKEHHSWAENSLLEDILTAANNNVDKASNLLETMAPEASFEKSRLSSSTAPTISSDISGDEKMDESLTLEKVMDATPIRSSLVGHLKDDDKSLEDRNASSGLKLYDDDDDDDDMLRSNMGVLNSVPVEPEWEEDDLYISHRKHALKMMRSASRHSRAAATAFTKGDHFSAQQNSMKAREEWHTAEELNSKAAKEILRIRNSENDIWRLDLHGLHALEAIQALQEHLNRIESHYFLKNSAASDGVKANGPVNSTNGSVNFMERENLDKKQAPLRLRPLALHVVTGIGNHSRGQAAIPATVRNFLNENRYRYEETRPGVITVWPKFRKI